MAKLSEKDKMLSAEAQADILKAKERYEKATTDAEREAAHADAEKIRNNAGYSGGADGTGNYTPGALRNGSAGKTAAQIHQDVADYRNQYYRSGTGWVNGYSVDMNTRSKANMIRQQMDANDEAKNQTTDPAYRAFLQSQNEELAKSLYAYTGHTDKTTYYNEDKGRWETWNPDVGYGYNMNGTQDNIRNAWKQYYGYTDEEIENWAKDTSHYYNFVDVMAPVRNTIDESSGFTGRYAQFVNGPYIPGTHYSDMEDVYGDGFGDEGTFVSRPQYDENGNIIKTAPALKGNNSASAYTQQFLPVPVNGVLTGHGPGVSAMDPNAGSNNAAGQRAYYQNYGRYAGGKGASGGGSVGSYEDYLRQLYASALEAQLKSLESGYQTNLSELDASQTAIDSAYTEQKRQTSGENARQSAAWREVANAYGLNSGAVGQANLAQRNQLQSNLNALNAAQASARTELQRQRLLLGQQYQSAIEQAVEENNSQLALNLYQEAVRAEEAIRQQEQFYANLALQYGKSMSSFAKNTDSMSMEAQFSLIEEAVKNGYISEAQALYWAQQLGLV